LKILITGGAGFVGSHLAECLAADGALVTCLDNYRTGRNFVLHPRIVYREGDVRDAEAVRASIRKADIVFHLAAAVGVRYCLTCPDYAFETNVVGTHNVLEACLRYRRELVYLSSSAVYGKTRRSQVSENANVTYGSVCRKEWFYSHHKATMDGLLCWYGRRGHAVKVLRVFNCIGRRQSGAYGMVVPRFVGWARRAKPIQVYGDGEQTRTFADVRDIVRGITLAQRSGRAGEPYNLGGTEEITIIDLARRVKKLMHSRSRIVHVPYDRAFTRGFEETRRRRPDIGKIRSLGYVPRWNTDLTLRWIVGGRRTA
jgi:UDP-glucose 4-epimerase